MVEAYRHLIDPIEDAEAAAALAVHLAPRILVTAKISVTQILDLRHTATRVQLGLTMDVLCSGTENRQAYAACQQVAQIAHQLGFHGLIAPAATRLGDALALFADVLPSDERPARDGPDELWQGLPADPRIQVRPDLRLIPDTGPEHAG